MNIIEGSLNSEKFKFAIIISRFNEAIVNNLLNGSIDCLKRHGCKEGNIDIIKVPGAFELPMAADVVAKKGEYDAIICLGAVIRGATPHFDYVAGAASSGIANTAINNSIPIIFGVLTTDTIEQAIERSGTKAGNKGWDCALAAIEMADLYNILNK
jgi:6,7-dimethyl-8-ribityllumazine synthase